MPSTTLAPGHIGHFSLSLFLFALMKKMVKIRNLYCIRKDKNRESGYKKEPIQVIMTIISKYESQQLKQIVASEDPDAFITYTDHLEIIGNFEKRFDA